MRSFMRQYWPLYRSALKLILTKRETKRTNKQTNKQTDARLQNHYRNYLSKTRSQRLQTV